MDLGMRIFAGLIGIAASFCAWFVSAASSYENFDQTLADQVTNLGFLTLGFVSLLTVLVAAFSPDEMNSKILLGEAVIALIILLARASILQFLGKEPGYALGALLIYPVLLAISAAVFRGAFPRFV